VVAFAVFSVLLAWASAAQAHEWIVEGKDLKEFAAVEEEGATFSSSQESAFFTFDWPIPSVYHFEWACTQESGAGFLWPATKSQPAFSSTTFKWTNCAFTEGLKCPIHFVRSTVKGELVENEKTKTLYEKFVPLKEGGTVMEFSWGQDPNSCISGEDVPFTGSYSAQLNSPGTELLTQPQTFSPAIDMAMGTSMKFKETTLTISGALKKTLTGELAGLKWGAK